jgi:hypothetical protein
MAYKNSSLKAIHEGKRYTKPGQPVVQPKDVFGPKKASGKLSGQRKGYNV